MPSRLDVSQSVNASGNSEALDTSGFGQVSFTAAISSLTGSGASIQIEIQASDDGTNYNIVHTTPRITANGASRISGIRISSQFYRYVWTLAGSSPSATIQITSTLKDYSPNRTGSLLRYDDIDLKTLNATSTNYSSFTNDVVGLVIVRTDAIASTGNIRIQVSSDNVSWSDASGDISLTASQIDSRSFDGMSHRFFRAIVTTAVAGAGTSTAHLFWSSTGGA